MEYAARTNWSQEAAQQMVEYLQHRVEAMAAKMEFLEAENEVLKQTLLHELRH
jgi:hypothetical protein